MRKVGPINHFFVRIKNFLPFQILCIILVGVAVYWGTLEHSFHFDDWPNIENNPNIQLSELSYDNLKTAFNTYLTGRPVAYLSFALNYYFHRLDVRGYHLVNILIHLLTGVLFYSFARETLRLFSGRDDFAQTKYIPLLAALIWLVHPLQVQSVTYIVQRMNSMGAMFYVMALLCYVKARLSTQNSHTVFFSSISIFAGILAFWSKENTITLPLFIVLYECYFFLNSRWEFTWRTISGMVAVVSVLLWVSYLFFGDISLSGLLARYDYRTFSLSERLLTEPRVILLYISLLLFPHPARLNLDYDFPLSRSLVSPLTTLGAIVVILGLLGLALYCAKKNRLYSFCIIWFLGNLVIESSIIPLEIAYEHRLYFPSMMAVFLFVMLFHKVVKMRFAFFGCLIFIVVIFSHWTYERNKVWKNDLTLWLDCYKKSPGKARVNQNLGLAHYVENNFDQALPYFNRALDLYLEDIKFQKTISGQETFKHMENLAKTFKAKGNYREAIKYYNKALQYFFFQAEAHYHLGQCYAEIWDFEKAIHHFRLALQYSTHHSTDVGLQDKAEIIIGSLQKAERMLKAQKQRSSQ